MDEPKNHFYANAVNISTSIYDVSLFFSIQSPVGMEKESSPMVETSLQCSVRMSPQHAKALAALLVKHIRDYEKQYSVTLPLPEELHPLWKDIENA